jgi:protein-export membrane protein SecD
MLIDVIIRRRIDQTGVSEPTIARQGSDRIVIQLPGVQDPDRLKRLLGTTAKMTFRLVDVSGNVQAAVQGRVPPDDELLYETEKSGTQNPFLVQRRVAVAGDRLTQAAAGFDPRTGEPVVNFGFDSRGAKEFGDITQDERWSAVRDRARQQGDLRTRHSRTNSRR